MKEANYWVDHRDNILCELCPNSCTILEGHLGRCGVRKNIDGKLFSLSYGKPVSLHIDPIEKKPLYHFMPAQNTLSIGTAGCNLSCQHCQNWEISQAKAGELQELDVPAEVVVQLAIDKGVKIISYTYNEPTVFHEYAVEIAKLAKARGIKNVIVTNGYINPKPAEEFCKYMDAANIDLKSFNIDFYYDICKGKFQPVLDAIRIYNKCLWVEITNLVIDGKNDSMEEIEQLAKWISDELGKVVPLHFSKASPMYNMQDISPTPEETLLKAKETAEKYLDFVYIGNTSLEGVNDTVCPKCGDLMIKRDGYKTEKLIPGKKCACGYEMPGVFE